MSSWAPSLLYKYIIIIFLSLNFMLLCKGRISQAIIFRGFSKCKLLLSDKYLGDQGAAFQSSCTRRRLLNPWNRDSFHVITLESDEEPTSPSPFLALAPSRSLGTVNLSPNSTFLFTIPCTHSLSPYTSHSNQGVPAYRFYLSLSSPSSPIALTGLFGVRAGSWDSARILPLDRSPGVRI